MRKRTSISLPGELRERVELAAEDDRRSVSQAVTLLIEEGFAHRELVASTAWEELARRAAAAGHSPARELYGLLWDAATGDPS